MQTPQQVVDALDWTVVGLAGGLLTLGVLGAALTLPPFTSSSGRTRRQRQQAQKQFCCLWTSRFLSQVRWCWSSAHEVNSVGVGGRRRAVQSCLTQAIPGFVPAGGGDVSGACAAATTAGAVGATLSPRAWRLLPGYPVPHIHSHCVWPVGAHVSVVGAVCLPVFSEGTLLRSGGIFTA